MQLKTDSACALRNSHPTQARCWAWGVEEQSCFATQEDLSSQQLNLHVAHLCAGPRAGSDPGESMV